MTHISLEEELEKTGTLCWTNVGVSMMPLLREGRDVLLIARKGAERCRKYDVVLFRRCEAAGRSRYILHRILRVNPDGSYWIVGDNCTEGEVVQEAQILGVLTAVQRNGRTLAVTDGAYRLYVTLWGGCWPVRIALLRGMRFAKRCLLRAKRSVSGEQNG